MIRKDSIAEQRTEEERRTDTRKSCDDDKGKRAACKLLALADLAEVPGIDAS